MMKHDARNLLALVEAIYNEIQPRLPNGNGAANKRLILSITFDAGIVSTSLCSEHEYVIFAQLSVVTFSSED